MQIKLTHQLRAFCLSLSGLVLLLGIASPVQAQMPGMELSISPPLALVDTPAGQPVTLAFTFKNAGVSDLVVTPRLKPFVADQASGTPVIETEATVSNVTITTPGFTLERPFKLPAGSSQQIVIEFNLTKPLVADATYTLLGDTQIDGTTQINGGVQTKVRGIIGANIILRSSNGSVLKSPIALENINVPSFIDSFGSLPLELSVHNDDATLHQAKGTVTLKYGGQVKELTPIFPDLVLAGSSRTLRSLITTDGQKQTGRFNYQGPFMPGIYTIEIALSSDAGTAKTVTKTVYAIPYIVIATLLLVLCLGLLLSQVKRPRHPLDSAL